jgi:hypothetical protein
MLPEPSVSRSFSHFLVVLKVENDLEASLLGWWDE